MKTTIEFTWWHDDSEDVPENDQYELIEYALRIINVRINDGYIAGELALRIDDIYYNGLWDLK